MLIAYIPPTPKLKEPDGVSFMCDVVLPKCIMWRLKHSSAPLHCNMPLPRRQISIISSHNSPICPHRPAGQTAGIKYTRWAWEFNWARARRPDHDLPWLLRPPHIRPPRPFVHDVRTDVTIMVISPSERPLWHSPERLAVATTRSSAKSNQFKQQLPIRRL